MKVVTGTLFALFIVTLWSCAQPIGLLQANRTEQLQQKARAGNAESQYQLGIRYTVNAESGEDYRLGYNWFSSAAQQEHTDARYMVGMGKLLGRGADVDRGGAVTYFSRAAEKGHMRAQYQVGNAYLNGAGVDKDQAWGRHWLEQAAWNGHNYAQFLLAALFSGGVGGKPNNVEAWRWAKKASIGGLERADLALQNLEEKMAAEELSRAKSLVKMTSQRDGELCRVPRIRYVQTALNQRGYHAGAEDGIEGVRTRSAVTEYLKQNGYPRNSRLAELIQPLRNRR